MANINTILSFLRTLRNGTQVSDVTINPGGGFNKTADNFPPTGDDAVPLNSDYAVSVDVKGRGRQAIVGYLDPKNVPVAGAGEKRIYARDAAGDLIVEVHLKADGECVVLNGGGSFSVKLDGSQKGQNANGAYELEAGGDFVVNGAVIDTTGKITSPTQVVSPLVTVDGKELKDHTHPIASGSSSPGPTGPNN
jgi:hypothetical protein